MTPKAMANWRGATMYHAQEIMGQKQSHVYNTVIPVLFTEQKLLKLILLDRYRQTPPKNSVFLLSP